MNQQLRVLHLLDRLHDIPKSQQSEFLDGACGDDIELRREIDSLLAMKEDAGDLFVSEEEDQVRTEFLSTKSEGLPGCAFRLQAGRLLSERYEIQATLGRGGMGEVYRAADLRLGRGVAIKILNIAALRNQQMRERFDRELKSVAALSHSNVVTLYDVASDGDMTFAVMELIDGTTLRNMAQERIDVDAAIWIAIDVAAGLAAAHRCNIMHRDIKPENIMVTSQGIAKILDFGIARTETSDDQVTQISSAGMMPGTPPYMSPEQAEGNDVGCSTDIFSFGTVLFEMLTGTNPFRGKSVMNTLQKICEAKRPRVSDQGGAVPKSLADLVDSMLQVRPIDRPSIEEVQNRLMGVGSSATLASLGTSRARVPTVETPKVASDTTAVSAFGGRPSIAVLPLLAVGSGPQNAMFGDAISHEVIVELSKLHSLMVIARGSSFQFRAPTVDLAEVGSVLAVKYVLTGTVDIQANRCLVSIELVRAADTAIMWAETFEPAMDDVLQLRHEITSQIVSAIEIQVQMVEAQHAMRLPTENLDAWSAYHRGLWHMYRFNSRDNEIAASLFDQAIDLDRSFARAHAGRSFTHFQQAFLNYSENAEDQQQLARGAAEIALQLDPLDPFVNLTMGRTEWISGNIERAGGWLDQSLQLSPSYAFANYNRGLVDVILNDGQRCEQSIQRALSLSPIDPLNYAMHCTLAFSHLVRGQFEDAVQSAERAIRVPTAHIHIYLTAAMANELAGNGDAARQLIAQIRQMDPDYSQHDFLRRFPFRDPGTVQMMQDSLSRLDI
jgi:serine/threonine protein kinase/Tfp pilus assembly protein PilF